MLKLVISLLPVEGNEPGTSGLVAYTGVGLSLVLNGLRLPWYLVGLLFGLFCR